MKIKKVLGSVLKKVSLSDAESEALLKKASEFVSSLRKDAGLRAFVGGSLAKGTLVRKRGKQDVDVFVVYDSEEEVSGLEKSLKKVKIDGEMRRVHGSRDYFQIEFSEVVMEVIPVVKVTNPELSENVTDFSLSHVRYVLGKIKKNKRLAEEIRLAKAFCQSQRCYGAESYIQGFSGYALEVLVIYFGSFLKFLKKISRKNVIDPERYFRGEREIMRELNTSKTRGPVVLVDPTYKYRNVTAGLSLETFEKFLRASEEFFEKPSEEFFYERDFNLEKFKRIVERKGSKFVEVELRTDRQEGDVAGTKMKKFFDFFCFELERKKQRIVLKEFVYSGNGMHAKGYLGVVERPEIEVKGPSVGLEEAARDFCKNRKSKVYQRGGSYWCREKVSIGDIFKNSLRVEKEMGAGGRLV